MTLQGHTLRMGLRLTKALVFGALAAAVAMALLASWQPRAAWTGALALAVGVAAAGLLALPEGPFAVAFRVLGAIVFGTLAGWLAALLVTWLVVALPGWLSSWAPDGLVQFLTIGRSTASWIGRVVGLAAGLTSAAVLAFSEMGAYVLRRLWWAAVTVFGVMIFTFLLFRVRPGDIAAANLGEKTPERQKAAWRHLHGYDRPWVLNVHRNLVIEDQTEGPGQFRVDSRQGGQAVDSLGLILDNPQEQEAVSGKRKLNMVMGRYVWGLSPDTPIETLTAGKELFEPRKPTRPETHSPAPAPPTAPAAQAEPATPAAPAAASSSPGSESPVSAASAPKAASESAPASAPVPAAPPARVKPPLPPGPLMVFTLSDQITIPVSVEGLRTAGDLLDRINRHPANAGKLVARITDLSWAQVLNSQFFRHLRSCILFDTRSLKGDNRTLTEIISQHAPYTLAVQIPVLAIEWCLGLAIACFVAYYRGTLIDKVGVFLTVLGMCIPFLAFMIFGQWAIFAAGFPQHANGLAFRGNVYVPIAIMVVAGLGGNVRFYRTVILDETGRDYVRTAKSKGLPLPTILFKHVLRNCMLPILTSLILSIPFLIMGSLLVESFFGIPGLGDLMITSVQDRNEPIMNGMVFLTSLIYTLGILVTDICYGVFDPRIRLR